MKIKLLAGLLAATLGMFAIADASAQTAAPAAQWAVSLIGGNKAPRFSSQQWSSGQGMVFDLSSVSSCAGLVPDDMTWTFKPAQVTPASWTFASTDINNISLSNDSKLSFWMLYSRILQVVQTKGGNVATPVGTFTSAKNQKQIQLQTYNGLLLARCGGELFV